jgi:UMF1 family MFS transporter
MGLAMFVNMNTVFLGLLFSITASVGFWGSLVFYNAFLPEIATPDRVDLVSAKGFGFGYIGSVLLLIFNLLTINFYTSFGFSTELNAVRFSFILFG